MDKEKEVTAFEAYQTAIQVKRFLKVFNDFEKILKVLAEYEVKEKNLKASVAVTQGAVEAAEKKLEETERQGEALKNKKTAEVEAVELRKKNTEAQLLKVEQEVSDKRKKALSELAEIEENKKKVSKELEAEIVTRQSEIRQLESQIAGLRKKASDMFEQMKTSYSTVIG